MAVWRPDQLPPGDDAAHRASWNRVGPRFFETIGVSFVEGRGFDASDRQGAPAAAIVNETLARRLWPGESPVGRPVVIDGRASVVVGLVPSAQYVTALEHPRPFVYTNFRQSGAIDERPVDSRTHVRVSGDARAMMPAIRRAVLEIDRDVPISEDRPLTEWLDYTFRPVRMAGTMLACFSGLAVFLSTIGLYGVIAAAVASRTREIAIRIALGAERREIAGLILSYGVRLTLAGTAAGIAIALASARVLNALLYGVRAFDPLTLAAVSALVGCAALAAIYLPARRAMRIEPMIALRYE